MEPVTSDESKSKAIASDTSVLTRGSEFGLVVTYGGPLVIGMMLHTFFNLVDFFICAQLGPAAINAVGISDIIMMIPTVIANGICTASIAIIARNYGLRRFYRASVATWHAFLLMFVLGALTGLSAYLFGEPMLEAFLLGKNQVGSVADRALEMAWAQEYLMISAWGSVTMFVMLQITSVLRAGGESIWPMVIFFMSTFLNVIGDILLVFGYEPLGIPKMGISGAAIASAIARVIGITVGGFVLFRGKQKDRITLQRVRLSLDQFWLLIRIGLPSSAQMVVRVLAVFILASIVYNTDATARPGYIICVRLEMLVIFCCLGWGAGASTLVGQNLGAGYPQRAQTSGWYSVLLGGLMMIVVAGCFIYWSDPLIESFIKTSVGDSTENLKTGDALSEEVTTAQALGRSYLPYVAPTYAFVAIAIILALSLNGAGSTKTPLGFDTFVLMVLMVPAAIVAGRHSLEMVWMVIAGANVLLAIPYLLWFRFGRWQHKIL